MAQFLIHSGKKLSGEVSVSGSKNAALPILAATLLTDKPCIIKNVPEIEDVRTMLKILSSLGSKVNFSNHAVNLQTQKTKLQRITASKIPSDLICKMRASVLLLGPLLARLKKIDLPFPGGCVLGARPMITHFEALAALGAKCDPIRTKHSKTVQDRIAFRTKGLRGTKIVLREFSVTATENTAMAACLASGETEIRLAATEPHVEDLCRFLVKMGANIKGIGTHTLWIRGVPKLHGVTHTITPDYLETGTLALAAFLTQGHVALRNIIPEHLDSFWNLLSDMGAKFRLSKKSVEIFPVAASRSPNHKNTLSSSFLRTHTLHAPERLQTNIYPGFPTDLQPPFVVLLTQCRGLAKIHEPLFEGRFAYLSELRKMGAKVEKLNDHEALVKGPTPLMGRKVKSWDIRAGAAMILAGLVTKGKTLVSDIHYIDRGYERLEEKLRKLGAEIERLGSLEDGVTSREFL